MLKTKKQKRKRTFRVQSLEADPCPASAVSVLDEAHGKALTAKPPNCQLGV